MSAQYRPVQTGPLLVVASGSHHHPWLTDDSRLLAHRLLLVLHSYVADEDTDDRICRCGLGLRGGECATTG